jgi:pimeloyl-ACP methyl ester carboxylesterase
MDAELLGRIRCPALLLYGEASDILDRAELLAAEIPGAELRILDGCSHSVLMEAPEEIGEQLHEWLGSLPVTSA